jgi:hypothetical protein
MTVKQAILSFPGLSDISGNFIEKLMLDRSLSGAEEYSVNKKKDVELCAADCYVYVLNSPNYQDGIVSVQHSRSEMRKTAERLYRENGEVEKADKLSTIARVVSRTNRW